MWLPRSHPFGRLHTGLLIHLLGKYADALESQGKLDAVDNVLDFMDCVVGGCHKGLRLT